MLKLIADLSDGQEVMPNDIELTRLLGYQSYDCASLC